MSETIYTIGHSVHPVEHFIDLLAQHRIRELCDVRSSPYSQYNPQYNRELLQRALRDVGVEYVFVGKELGARSEDASCYVDGRASYERMAQTENFQRGLERVLEDAQNCRLALMCAEKDPLTCHRTILVARQLAARGARIAHILEDGTLESHDDALRRLLRELKMDEYDLLRTREDMIEDAYAKRGGRIAYRQDQPDSEEEADWRSQV